MSGHDGEGILGAMLSPRTRAWLRRAGAASLLATALALGGTCIESVSLFQEQFACEVDGDCIAGWRCDHGICASGGSCVPSCDADPCGDDGCGGFCGPCMVHYGMNAKQLQSLLDKVAAQQSFRARWIDGFQVAGGTFYNAIFDEDPTGKLGAMIDLNEDELEDELQSLRNAGKQAVQLEAYPKSGGVRYALVSEHGPGPHWCAVFGLGVAAFQDEYDRLASSSCQAGESKCNDDYTGCYRPVNVAVVPTGGELRFSALFHEAADGQWEAQSLVDTTDFFSERAVQQAAGRELSYLNAYVLEGVPRLSVIWDTAAPGGDTPTIDLDGDEFREKASQLSAAGLMIWMLTGWETDNEARYGGTWLTF